MSNLEEALTEPLVQEAVPRCVCCGLREVALLSFLLGFGCVAGSSAWRSAAKPSRPQFLQPFLKPSRLWQSILPSMAQRCVYPLRHRRGMKKIRGLPNEQQELLRDTKGQFTPIANPMQDQVRVRTALVSVFDTTGLEDLGRYLASQGVHILATGSSATTLRKVGCTVQDLAEYTGPEVFESGVITLHPRVHGGLLATHSSKAYEAEISEHGILPIDLVIVNVQPFNHTLSKGGNFATHIDNIDVEVPVLMRASAKNCARVTSVTSPGQYAPLIEYMRGHDGCTGADLRMNYAAVAFKIAGEYDTAVSAWYSRNAQVADTPVESAAAAALGSDAFDGNKTGMKVEHASSSGSKTGVMISWNMAGGFGFIQPDNATSDGRRIDLFCHVSKLVDGDGSVREGDRVTYLTEFNEAKKKYQAADVRLAASGEVGDMPRVQPDRWMDAKIDDPQGFQGIETGILVRWNSDRGFGFIRPSSGGDDLFCHFTSLLDGDSSVRDFDRVTYMRVFDKRTQKYKAVDVSRFDSRGGTDVRPDHVQDPPSDRSRRISRSGFFFV